MYCNTNNESHIKIKYYLIYDKQIFRKSFHSEGCSLNLLNFYIIEFHQILPKYYPMYNEHKIKKKNIGYHVNLFKMAISVLMGVGWGNYAYTTILKDL